MAHKLDNLNNSNLMKRKLDVSMLCVSPCLFYEIDVFQLLVIKFFFLFLTEAVARFGNTMSLVGLLESK